MRNQRLAALIGMVGFLGAAAFACSSSTPPTDFGGNGNSSNGNSSNNGNSNNSSNNSGYGGTSASNHTSNNGNTSNNNTSNNNTSNNNSTVGNGSSTPATGGTACGTPPLACAATAAAGAVATTSCFFSGTKGSGYTYYFGDGTSTACVNPANLCTMGQTAVVNPPSYSLYGAGIGIGLNQLMGGTDAGALTTLSSGGLQWAVSGTTPPFGLQVGIDAASGPCSVKGGCCFRPATTATSGTIPWSSFVTDCYDATPDGGTFSPADGLLDIKFQAISGATAGSYNYCVTTLSY